jgi:hypothetical protein
MLAASSVRIRALRAATLDRDIRNAKCARRSTKRCSGLSRRRYHRANSPRV